MSINVNENPEVIMFVDDAFAYGLERNYYKEYESIPGLEIKALSEAQKYNLKASENDIFYYNPYQQIYLPQSDNLHIQFLEAKMHCYINVFRYMGAISVSGKAGSIKFSKSEKAVNVNAKYGSVGAGIDVESSIKEKIEQNLEVERKFGGELIKSKEEIEDYISKFNLWNDSKIKFLYDQFDMEGKLTGSFNHKIALASELNKSLDIAVNLDAANIFQLDSTFKSIQENRLEVSFEIKVQFPDQ